MVVKGTGIHGQEHSGTAEAERQALGTAATMAGAAVGKVLGSINTEKKKKRTGPDLEADYAENNPLYKAFYESYTARGVDEDVAHKAAIARVEGEDAETNKDIAAADLAASQWTPGQSTTNSTDTRSTGENNSLESSDSAFPTEEAQPVSSPLKNHSEQVSSASQAPSYDANTVSKMKWLDVQDVARNITNKTSLKPEGRKRRDVEAFVVEHAHKLAEQAEEQSPIATDRQSDTEKDEVTSAPPENTEDHKVQAASKEEGATFTDNISAGYKERAVPPDQAEAASKDFAQGKDASNSPAIAGANEQVRNPVTREPLHQMFYEALTKSGVDSELADKAGKDMAEGKGAKSSEYVKQAQNYALDKDIDKSRMSKPEKDWLKASRYNTTRDPRKRDREIAVKGHRNGMSKREVINMLKLSPVAAAEGKKNPEKGMQYVYTVQKKAERTVNQTQASQKNKLMKQKRKAGISV